MVHKHILIHVFIDLEWFELLLNFWTSNLEIEYNNNKYTYFYYIFII